MAMKTDSVIRTVVMPADFVVWLERFSEFRNFAKHFGEWNSTGTATELNDAPITPHYSVIFEPRTGFFLTFFVTLLLYRICA